MNTPFLSIAALMNKNGFLIQQLMIKAKSLYLTFFFLNKLGTHLIQNHLVLVLQPAILLSKHVFFKGNSSLLSYGLVYSGLLLLHALGRQQQHHLGIQFNWPQKNRETFFTWQLKLFSTLIILIIYLTRTTDQTKEITTSFSNANTTICLFNLHKYVILMEMKKLSTR